MTNPRGGKELDTAPVVVARQRAQNLKARPVGAKQRLAENVRCARDHSIQLNMVLLRSDDTATY
jgi:hypothetical protein